MNALAPPLVRLRRPLIALTLSILGSGALLLWSQAEHDAADALLRQHTARLTQARATHQAARDAYTATRNGLRQLEALRGAGLLDAPDRQAWQQHLLKLQGKLPLDKLEWELGPFAPAATEADSPSAGPPSALRVSTLHLKGEVAHEGRLLPLLERPGNSSNGLFLPRRCRLAHKQPAPDAAGTPALAADCEIDWIFLPLPDAP